MAILASPWLTVAAGLSSFAHFGVESPVTLTAARPAGPQVEYRYGAPSRRAGWDYKGLLRAKITIQPGAPVGSSGKVALMFDGDIESTMILFRRTANGVRWEGGGVGGRVRGRSRSLSFSVEAKEFLRTQALQPGRHRFRAELSMRAGMRVASVEVNRSSGIFPTRQPDQPLRASVACADPVGQGARTVTVHNIGRIRTGPIRVVPMSLSQDAAPAVMRSIAPGKARTVELSAVDRPDLAATDFAVSADVGSTIARCPAEAPAP